LRNEVRQLKCVHKEEITELERRYTVNEREKMQTIATLEAEVKTREDRYDSQVSLCAFVTLEANLNTFLLVKVTMILR
jgi:hypothetical protein